MKFQAVFATELIVLRLHVSVGLEERDRGGERAERVGGPGAGGGAGATL